MKKALCIISGGMDSTLCAYLAKKEGYELVALHFDYHQRTQDKERACFEAICKDLRVAARYVLRLDFFKQMGANALVDESLAVPKNALESHAGVPITYVPFRNGVFLSIAASIAEKERCETIYIGVVAEDGSGYPDCTREFIAETQRFINAGRAFKSVIKTPLIDKNKGQIVALALSENVPLQLTWSCYEREDKACGECDSCLLRLKGFKEAGARDKIEYV